MPDYRDLIEMYRSALPPGEIVGFRIDTLDHVGTPIYNVDFFARDGRKFNGVGYGSTEEEAMLGAFGELSEEYHLEVAFDGADQVTGSYRTLVSEYGSEAVLDPLELVLPAGGDYTEELPLDWVQIERLGDGQPTWCPSEFVAVGNQQVPYPNRMTTAIRNGSGAGDTLERALLHGTLELLQRDGNADAFRALDRGVTFDPASLPVSIRQLLDRHAAVGLHIVPKLARTTCGCASVYAVGDDRTEDDFPLSITACGEAADPDTEAALRKAILECASSHSRKRYNNLPFAEKADLWPEGYGNRLKKRLVLEQEEQRALRAMTEWLLLDRDELRSRLQDSVFKVTNHVNFDHLPSFAAKAIPDRWQKVAEELKSEHLSPYVFRANTTDGRCEVVKMIVPGIEMEFASYHRIGYRGVKRLLEREDLDLLSREPGPGRKRILLTAAREEALGGPWYLAAEKLDRIVDPLYALYREPSAHAANVAIETNYFPDLNSVV